METVNKSFGVILSLKMSNFDLSKELIATAFKEAGIDEKFIPYERMPRKAFQKALQEAITGEDGFMIRPVFKQGTTMSSGLVREQKNAAAKDLKYDVCNVLTLDSSNEVIEGKGDFRTAAIKEAYEQFKGQLGAVEISFKLKEIFFVSMAINVLCNKAIFIPSKYKPNVDKIVELFANLRKIGGTCEIDVIAVDSDTGTRNTIVKEFAKQTLEQLEKEHTFSLKQREKLESGRIKYLRPTAFTKQLQKINLLKQRIQTYILLLDLTPEEDKLITDKLLVVETEILRNMDLCETRSAKSSKKGDRLAAVQAVNP